MRAAISWAVEAVDYRNEQLGSLVQAVSVLAPVDAGHVSECLSAGRYDRRGT